MIKWISYYIHANDTEVLIGAGMCCEKGYALWNREETLNIVYFYKLYID